VGLSRIDRTLSVLFAMPLLLLYVDKSWLFSSFGYIDSWIYSGYFIDLPKHMHSFPGTYYGTRLSWLLPGFLAYHIFPPLVALHLLHILFYELAVLSLYLVLKHTVNQRAAALTAILMGGYSFFLWAIGWDYVDGTGITYFLLTMLALTYAAKSRRFDLWLVVAGICFGCLIHSQLFLGVLTPVFILYYVVVNRSYRRNALLLSLLLFSAGAISLTCLLAIINWSLGGQFLFFLPSIQFTTTYVRQPNPWRVSSYTWLLSAASLVLPAVVLVSSVAFLLARGLIKGEREDGAIPLFQFCFILTVIILSGWELAGLPVLQSPHYASYLIPTMFLAIGSQVARATQNLGSGQFCLLLGAIVCIIFLPFSLSLNTPLAAYVSRWGFLLPILLGLAGLLSLSSRCRHLNVPGMLLLCAACATFNMGLGTRAWQKEPALGKDAFLAVVESEETIKIVDPNAAVLFWYDFDTRPLGNLYRSVSSEYLWAYRLFSEHFPMPDESRRKPAPGMKIVILSTDEQALERADRSLKKMGFGAYLVTERTIRKGQISYDMIFIDVIVAPECGASSK